jgi:hypothetical protein
MTTSTDTIDEAGATQLPAPIPVSGSVIAAFGAMIDAIPEAGDGMESILLQLAQATTAAELDAPWDEASGLRDLIDERITITGARRVASDYTDGLGWFLVLDVQRIDTGELLTVTTGAVSVVAQVAKGYQIGALPLRCIPREATRPTKDGYLPIHLEMIA